MHKKVLVCALSIMTTLGFLILPKPIQASHAYDGPEVKLADGRNFSFSVRGSLGYLNGEARELVYDFDQGYRRKASELIWDLKGLGMIGGIASVKYSKWLNVNLGIWTTMNEGNTWESEVITSNSEKNNIRPVVTRGYKSDDALLFWMYGNYIGYTNYKTEIRMK